MTKTTRGLSGKYCFASEESFLSSASSDNERPEEVSKRAELLHFRRDEAMLFVNRRSRYLCYLTRASTE